jgi:phosphatidylglycerophosphate synthase
MQVTPQSAPLEPDPRTQGGARTTAVILPATRMSFHPIAGIPLIQRIALSAQRAGFADVIVLASDEGDVATVLRADERTRSIPIVLGDLTNQILTERVALIPSDCLVTADLLRNVREYSSPDPVLFAPQGRSAQGILLGARELVVQLTRPHGNGNGNGNGGSAHSATPSVEVKSLGDELYVPVSSPEMARAAEKKLLAALRRETADTDGPLARFDRGLSTRLSRLLVRTPLRPNHITMIGTSIGLSAAWCFARGGYESGLAGALLFWFAVIVDGCDGEVARLKFQETSFGHLFDVITDNLVHVAIFIGLGLGQYRVAPQQNYPLLLAILLIGFGLAVLATYVCLIRHPPVLQQQPRSASGKRRQRLLRGFELLMNRDFAYLIVAIAVFDLLAWFLWLTAFGTYVYAAGLFWVYSWDDD